MSTRIARRAAFAVAFSLLALCSVHPAIAAQRTFVATSGSDSSATCSLVAPCRGFAKAITVTDPGGELVVLDSGGYGSVTVNKNVTILSPAGVYAGISVFAGTDGITVTAPATKVVLRGLTINGQTGDNGIRVQAGEVHIESTVISNMAKAGILVEGGSTVRVSGTVSRSNVDGLRVAPTAGTVSVLVRDSEFSNNATAGIGVSPSPPVSNAMVTVERTSVTKNGAGIVTAAGTGIGATVIVTQSVASENVGAGVSVSGNTANVFVRESAITRNGTGLLAAAGGQLTACGANLLVANGTAQSGFINVNAAACLDQLAGGTGTVTSVGTGPGLAGGPITTAGTINLASTQLLPTVACGNTQVPKWNGAAWTCGNDNDTNSGGTVTSVTAGSGLTGGTITTSGTIAVDPASSTLTGAFFSQNGNAFGASAVLGTSDANVVQVKVNNAVALTIATNGKVGVGTLTPNEQLELTGNLRLPYTTATSGIIRSGPDTLMHAFGYSNFFAGIGAGNLTMTASSNVGVGLAALSANMSGGNNTASGVNALTSNLTGDSNTASGLNALANNTGGSFNAAIGTAALNNNTTGNNNTGVGFGASGFFSNLSNATAIGANALVDASNHVRIGDANVTQIGGQVAWSNLSDRREKTRIRELSIGLDFVKSLRPVEFRMRNGNDRIDFGFIAQDVEALLGTNYNVLGIGATAERKLSLRYTDFVAPMVKAIQQQQALIEAQQARLERQEAEVAAANEALRAQQATLTEMRVRIALGESLRDELAALKHVLTELREERSRVVVR